MGRKFTVAVFAAGIAVGCLAPAPARADSLVSLPEPDYVKATHNPQQQALPTKISYLVYPTLGAAAILGPGEELTPIVCLGDNGSTTDWRARLESSRDLFTQTVPLTFRSQSFDPATSTYRLSFQVPPGIPEDTWDLVVESASIPTSTKSDAQYNAVRILRPRNDYDFCHIADSQIRDPTTRLPQKWEQLLAELRLRDPAYTLYSGDLNFGADYTREYPENWQIMKNGGVALDAAPGNHDGYSWMADATTIFYDGLHIWRRMIGPTYFAFKYGKLRFLAVNSFDGDAVRRNSYTFLCHNAGGHVGPEQMTWIDAQVREAVALGEEPILFMHHSPRPDITLVPGVPGYPWQASLVGAGNGIWNEQSSRDQLTDIIGRTPELRWLLIGHTHADDFSVRRIGAGATAHDVNYVTTTSPACGGSPYDGYRMIEVRGGRIANVDYDATRQSVPLPLGGNFGVTFLDANDGQGGTARARVTSLLDRPTPITLKFFMRADPRGYRTSAGYIREVGLADLGAYVVYVRVEVPPTTTGIEVQVSPDPLAQGARPAALGGAYNPGIGPGGGAIVTSSGGGGGGCQASAAGGDPTAVLPWALVLGALVALRGGRSKPKA